MFKVLKQRYGHLDLVKVQWTLYLVFWWQKIFTRFSRSWTSFNPFDVLPVSFLAEISNRIFKALGGGFAGL